MKAIIFSCLALVLSFSVYAQDYTDKQNIKVETTQEAQYPGGEEKLYQDVYYNLKYSEEAKKNKAEGTVMVSFFVEPDSTVKSVKIISEPGFGCGESVKEFLLNTKFAPAMMNGTPFRTQLMLNVPVRAH
jgi:TonB family protein